MSKITSKYQVSIPRALAEKVGRRIGDEPDAQMRAYAERFALDEIVSEGFSDGQLIGTVRIRNRFRDIDSRCEN